MICIVKGQLLAIFILTINDKQSVSNNPFPYEIMTAFEAKEETI